MLKSKAIAHMYHDHACRGRPAQTARRSLAGRKIPFENFSPSCVIEKCMQHHIFVCSMHVYGGLQDPSPQQTLQW